MRLGPPISAQALAALSQLSEVRSQTRRVAAAIRDDARRRAPVRTGELRKSIKVVQHRDSSTRAITYRVTIGAFYGRFAELGTINQPATPMLRPAADAFRRGDIRAKEPRRRTS